MKRVSVFYRYETDEIKAVHEEVLSYLEGKADIVDNNPELVIVIGGDGAMMEAARKYQTCGSEILGINRGTVGFLASVDRGQNHIEAIQQVLEDKHRVIDRTLVTAVVERDGRQLYETIALNDVVISSPLSVVELDIAVDGNEYLTMRGTGMLVSTPTGSTAYNLSAHGPILMPQVSALIVTELLDHSIPTPSLIVDEGQVVTVTVGDFRVHKQLQLKTGEPADVVLDADGADLFSLKKGDKVTLQKADSCSKFVEFDDYNFFSHLRDKFEI